MFSIRNDAVGMWLDLRRMELDPEDLASPVIARALADMEALEKGGLANSDENKPVGHYWLREPSLAPGGLGEGIQEAVDAVESIVREVLADGEVEHVLLVGVGGSVLGTEFVARALLPAARSPRLHVLDNTDPDGIQAHLSGVDLGRSLVVVVSKSGSTMETCNALAEVEAAMASQGVSLAPRALAVSLEGTPLWTRAADWRGRLPMWSWVGGRFSVTSAVGLLPLALLGVDIRAFLEGASLCDAWTRQSRDNPALLLALAWHKAGEGRGERDMVVIPYKDQLSLMPRYLQQVVMESVGKKYNAGGEVVHQGLTVYGNKGSTDQHSLVQQLREGPDDFFAAFVAVLEGSAGVTLEAGHTTGDCLLSMLLGTRRALGEAHRQSLTLTLDRVDARTLGAVVALFERAVGFYGSMISINAYHQPGVEAGKQAADFALEQLAQLRRGAALPEGDDTDLLLAYEAARKAEPQV